MKFKIILIAFAFVLASCTNNSLYSPDKLVEIERPIPVDTLKAETIYLEAQIDTTDYYVCTEILCVGPYLVQLTTSNKHYIKMIDMNNPQKTVLFGGQGHAGDEFVIIPTRLNSEETEDGSLLIYGADYGRSSIVCIDAEASFREEKCIVRKSYNFHAKAGFNTFVPFYRSDSENMIAGYQEMAYIDARDNIYSTPKFYFFDEPSGIEMSVYPNGIVNSNPVIITIAYNAALAISPDRSKVVESLFNVDITNVWDLKSHEVLGIVGKGEATLEYCEITSDGEYYEDNMKNYTGNVTLSNDKIFRTSLRGLTNAEYSSDTNSNRPSLEVYNYSGELLGSFFLEQKSPTIAYSDYYDCLFARGPENIIYKYELPKWLKKN